MKNHEKILKSIGLDNNEAKVYLEAIKLGSTQASIIGKQLGIPRTTARYACEELVKKNLMNKVKKGNSMIFTAEKPNMLKNQVQLKKNTVEENEEKLDSIMGNLMGLYNPYAKLPKVTFYEGEEGIKKVLDDALTSKETIDSFINIKNVMKSNNSINEHFTKKRNSLKIKKRTIYENKESLKETIGENFENDFSNEYNEIKYINDNEFGVYISLMIYDGKSNYISFEGDNLFGVIIDDEKIYSFNKNIFNLLWKNTN